MEETLSPGRPVDSVHAEALRGQCQQYQTNVNCNNRDDWHESSSKQFCIIQIKVTTNMPQIPHMVKAWAADSWYLWAEGQIFIKYYTKIPSRFSRVSFDTEKLNWKHRDVFAPLSFIPNKEEFSFIWVQFQFSCLWGREQLEEISLKTQVQL